MLFICQKLFVFRKFGANFHKIYVYRVYQNKKGAAVQRCSIKILFRNDFANFTGRHMCRSYSFNEFAGLQPVALLKKRLRHRYFPVNLLHFFRKGFL